MAKVSICLPTYNGAEHLRECLDSVGSQSHRDFEVIAVDDQSSDETWDLLNQYAARDNRIRPFRNDRNRGLVENWNRCIELANGDWIKFLFQDDVLSSNCVELMLQSAQTASRPIVFCQRGFLFEETTNRSIVDAYESIPSIDVLAGGVTDISPELVQDMVLREGRNFFGEPTATLLHKSLFRQFDRFNQDLAQFCDLEYWIRVAINTGLAYVPNPLATFRYHARSASARNRDPLRMERIEVFDGLIMLHEYAYNRHFAPLRRRAKYAEPRRRFRWELAKRARWVRSRAKALASAPGAPDISWNLQWERVVERYPAIGWSFWKLPFDAQSWLSQHVGWRFRKR